MSMDYDVAIIGAGFAGAASARALAAHRGVSVIMLERADECGRFASGRSVGMGRQLAEDDDTTRFTVAGAALLRNCPVAGVWAERGGVLTFDDDEHLERYVRRGTAFSIPCQPLDSGELQRLGVNAPCGLWVASDGLIDVTVYLRWLVDEAQRHGADLRVNTAVTGLDAGPLNHRDRRVTVTTTRGTLRVRVVIDAAGAWAGSLIGRPLEALRRHVFAVTTDAGFDATSLRRCSVSDSPPFVWHVGPDEVYARPHGGEWLVSPCDERPGPAGQQTLDADAEAELRRRLMRFGSDWTAASIAQRWSCQRTFAADRRIKVERDVVRPWLVWAAALGGHGATAAAAVGERACALALAAIHSDTDL
jgi:D-arginine dehydrogenase